MLLRPLLMSSTTPSTASAATRLSAVSRHLSSSSPPPPAKKQQRPQPPGPDKFRYFLPFQTSWRDNDSYGHLNNAVYQQYFDSIINHYLLHHAYPSPPSSASPSSSSSPTSPSVEHAPSHPIGLIASSSLLYASSLSYPSPVVAALAISNLGARSVEWSVALFEGEYAPALRHGEVEGFALEDVLAAGGEAEAGPAAGLGRKVRIKGGKEAKAASWGKMVHVFVNQESRKAVQAFEDGMRGALERLIVRVEERGDGEGGEE